MTTTPQHPHPGLTIRPEVPVRFPAGFRFGAATAAYQIEGSADVDGRGPSIWDTFSHTPGRTLGGDTGDLAADHYRRFRGDVAMMAALGLTAYRFSISWSRVIPDGSGQVNQAGLDYYRALIEALLEAGVEPWPTLYHWDLPQWLEDAGGWPERDTAARFADYAATVHSALGDLVPRWTTMNEPWCAAFLGYASGEHAPGRCEPAASIRATHHLLLGHGLAAAAIRAQRADALVGITLNLYAVSPAGPAEADADAARRVDGMQNRLFLDAVLLARYPDDVIADLAGITGMEHVRDGDLATIGHPPDFLGVNYYSRHTVSGLPAPARTGSGEPEAVRSSPFAGTTGSPWPGSEHVRFVDGGRPVTGMGWEIDEPGLTEVLERIARDYPAVPMYVTENGAAFDDRLDEHGRVADQDRIAFIAAHLTACHRAIERGVPLHGYFVWSLMDNFEWGWGYAKRFGLVYVDFATQERIFKDSALWYRQVIRQGGFDSG